MTRPSSVELLLPLSIAKHQGENLDTALIVAARERNLEMIRILSKSSDITAANLDGSTALHEAFPNGKSHFRDDKDALLSIIHLLPGSDINALDGKGRTPLIKAIEADEPEIFSLMLPRANSNLQNDKGMTPIMHAVNSKNKFFFDSLLPISDLTLRDQEGKTTLMNAVQCRYPDRVAALLSGSDVNHQDHEGRTALMHAFASDWAVRDEIIAILLEVADVRLKNKNGKAAADFVTKKTNDSIAKKIRGIALALEDDEQIRIAVDKPLKEKKKVRGGL